MVVLLIFSVLSIFWGSLWKIPAHQLNGWIVVSLIISLRCLNLALNEHALAFSRISTVARLGKLSLVL